MIKTGKKGFTLIELLMVVATIALFASVMLANMNISRKKARDAKRISDMYQIQKALNIYLDKYETFPNGANDFDGWDIGCGSGDSFIAPLKPEHFTQVPADPNGCSHTAYAGYMYHHYAAGENGCPAERGEYYVIGFFDAEFSERPHPQSPGFACSGKDWKEGFDWVAGGYEN